MVKTYVFAAALLVSAAIPAGAQDIATRILNIENQIRNLTGQIEELNHSVQLLQQQMGSKGQQSGALDAPDAAAPATQQRPNLKKLAEAPIDDAGAGIETITDAPAAPAKKVQIVGADVVDPAPGPTTLGSGQNNSAANGDFSGQVLVPEENTDVASAASPTQPAVDNGQPGANSADSIEQVSLTPATDTPEAMYEKYYEALLRRQFGEAEAGFRSFLQKYPQHSLAGSAQYQLGETAYAQGDFQEAARNFLQGYKNYPKSRRAPDSLLKLGLSLRKLDQKDQACAALASVSTEFPRAVEAKKRAQAEYKRAGC